ncbi:twin-arginine translocase subunit TatC [Corynebacterium choanae]|uniref:Sec-independent protein translocase protein TatC n=1 Tax=Corynebacterium choanae TaxID=1862358 RepID=A0A3G6JAQ5_9CORY|nr:twin-arginine translocase subunit TatC [Corynebacterium choanae]AZA13560.1 Sec-independent protein translocase protein TatC [Corynebacterium choanae]
MSKQRLGMRRLRRGLPATGDMTLVEHLQELRRRVIVALIALAAGTLVGFIWYQHGLSLRIGGSTLTIPTLGDILRGPYCAIPPENRADFSADGSCKLLATGPFEMFMLRLKVGALAGAVFSSPVWLGQLWGFITPGLKKNEKLYTRVFVSLAVVLFTIGAVLAYYLISIGLSFLLSIGDETQTAALSGLRYYNFLLALLVIFGVSFELPLLVVMLNIAGVLSYEVVKDKRRYIIVGLFVFAAVATPTQDPFSMVVLAVALIILVEGAFQFCRLNDKRRTVSRPEWLDVSDEAASPLGDGPGGIGRPEPVVPSSRPTPQPLEQPQRPQTHIPQSFDDVL